MARLNTSTSFVGREADLEKLAKMLAPPGRIVTVLGPAGVGKTRLVTSYIERHPKQNSWFCDLTETKTDFDLVGAIGRALRVPLDTTPSVELAIEPLAQMLSETQDPLLVLDNFEQLIENAPLLSHLISNAAALRLLVTSRERLGLPEELVLDLGRLNKKAARALFIDRARAVRSDYSPKDKETEEIDAICEELDGLPLALELAAARIRVLSTSALKDRLDRRFELLSPRGRSTRPARHATLKAAIDWSWGLMQADEQDALATIAIFEGGFSLEAAEAVLQKENTLDLLHALLDKSLLFATEHEGVHRFGLYQSIREYALDKLGDQKVQVKARHTDYYLKKGFLWAARAERIEDARAKLGAERANLLAVFKNAETDGKVEAALRAAIALQPLLITHGPGALRLELLERALRLIDDVHQLDESGKRLVGWTHLALADTFLGLGELQRCKEELETARALGEETQDPRLLGVSLWRFGSLRWAEGNADAALSFLHQARDVLEQLGDALYIGWALAQIGAVKVDQGAFEEAEPLLQQALRLHKKVGDRRSVGVTLEQLGMIADARKEPKEARAQYEESLRIQSAVGDSRQTASARSALGMLALDEGSVDESEAAQREALSQRATPDLRGAARVHLRLGLCLQVKEDLEGANQSFERALEIQRTLNNPRLQAITLAHLASILVAQRATARAERLLAEGHSLASDAKDQVDKIANAHLRIAEGHLQLAKNDRVAARESARAAQAVQHLSAGLRRMLDILERAMSEGLPVDALAVGNGWFKPPKGARVDISSRKGLGALLLALVAHRRAHAGQGLSVDAMFLAGWPGERALESAAASRVYVAISTLRKLGLKTLIIRDDAGYRLDENVELVVAE